MRALGAGASGSFDVPRRSSSAVCTLGENSHASRSHDREPPMRLRRNHLGDPIRAPGGSNAPNAPLSSTTAFDTLLSGSLHPT